MASNITLCLKCGRLSFYDPYFKVFICESCGHRQSPELVENTKEESGMHILVDHLPLSCSRCLFCNSAVLQPPVHEEEPELTTACSILANRARQGSEYYTKGGSSRDERCPLRSLVGR